MRRQQGPKETEGQIRTHLPPRKPRRQEYPKLAVLHCELLHPHHAKQLPPCIESGKRMRNTQQDRHVRHTARTRGNPSSEMASPRETALSTIRSSRRRNSASIGPAVVSRNIRCRTGSAASHLRVSREWEGWREYLCITTRESFQGLMSYMVWYGYGRRRNP